MSSLNADSDEGDKSMHNKVGASKFQSRYDRKGGKSMSQLDTNKVNIGDNHREYVNFLADINPIPHGSQIGRGSMNSSHMMIEISDVDIKDPLVRANTVTGNNNGDYNLNLKAPPSVV